MRSPGKTVGKKFPRGFESRSLRQSTIKVVFPKESIWIKNKIGQTHLPKNSVILDVGASDFLYRTEKQPYINDLYKWIVRNHLDLKTLDIDPSTKCDFVFDISDSQVNKIGTFDIVIASNLLEHILPNSFSLAVDHIQKLVKKDGFLIVTVPLNIEKHPSPIDNGFRPKLSDLYDLFKDKFNLIEGGSWVDEHYREPYISDRSLAPLPEVTGVFLRKK